MSLGRTALSGLALALAGSLALTACGSDGGGGDDGGQVTLRFTWWGADERSQRYEEAIALFEEANPDIEVQTGFAEFQDYWTQRSTDATSGELPDVLQMDLSRLLEYTNAGLLYDMTEFEGNQLDTSQIDEELLASGQVDEQLLGIPTGTNTWALHYNPDLLAELGVEPPEWDYTWEDYHAFVAEVSEAGADLDPRVHGATDYTVTWWVFLQWLVQQGTEPFAENGEMNFTEDDLRTFLSSTDALRDAGHTFPIERLDQLTPLGGFNSGEAAVEFHWDNFIHSYANDLGNENIQLMPMPSGPDGEKHMFYKPSMQLSMGANTAHPEEAAALIDFLINDPEAGQIIGTDLGVPASQGRLDALDVEDGSLEQRAIEYEQRVADEGYVTETVPRHPEGFGALETEYVEVLGNEFSYGQIDADDFVDRLFTEAENLLVTE
ncbi:ABC transporter substrate-binding protein [Streptomyces radicis]|uniref:Carbohydrate ABC transporter substrate-binding protein n=1 Tax=Streptomyces radicis TaxID=1750517 RepID=A0A3A9VYN6_9ACTN|nr:ABC transporter substrate-binding protein [Streptomyces radicis]RKN06068.1 carbohydrate ABC transporter substrate-binding protein [Streptomyces radicis]RKN18437.1 carbohydrate ABC transporter substrate-binding protein [Streptomyces radicis]